ncbi:phage holin family protein [Candidatus Parcubacteria bacterium]|nr:phage holin family protein [Candidatus Parcubacteria bacterium]
MKIILKLLITSFAIILSAYLISGVTVVSIWSALWVALILGLINITIKPLLVILTLPINILTLGLFTFIINAGMILLVSSIVKGFYVEGFLTALIFSFVLSLISYILHKLFGAK